MKVGSIPFSQIGRYNRMDATFHLAIADIAEELKEFEAKDISKEVCIAQLEALPLYALEAIRPLLRGGKVALNRETASRAIREYPIEAWLLTKRHISGPLAEHHQRLRELDQEFKALQRFI
jgi:hypothetical protein